MFTWQYIYLCCINIALLSISLLGYYMLGLFKPFLTPDTFPWDIFSCFKVPSWINICTVQNVFTVQCKYYDYMIQLRGALIDWTLDGVSRSSLRWVYQQELQGPWLVSSCSLCLWYLHALCNCDCSIYWYFNFSVYMKYGRINMFLFLFIFVTKIYTKTSHITPPFSPGRSTLLRSLKQKQATHSKPKFISGWT